MLGIGLWAVGCAGSSDDRLVVATNWPEEACERLERSLSSPIRIRWIRVGPHEDPTRALIGSANLDVVLGGPQSSYERLRISGRLASLPIGWRVALPGKVRDDLFALMAAQERPGEWSAVFGRLVRDASANPSPRASTDAESAAIAAGSRHQDMAIAFLDATGGTWVRDESPSLPMVNDLLTATLVVAKQERLAAREALERAGNSSRSLALFAEAPPWPPASIEKMRARTDGESLMSLLAEQVAPDPVAREWLIKSLNQPSRPLDGGMLDILARAAEGRLVAEPRFQAWLRSEWGTWARQRYRRVITRLENPRYAPP